jgi:hypothetical protein
MELPQFSRKNKSTKVQIIEGSPRICKVFLVEVPTKKISESKLTTTFN